MFWANFVESDFVKIVYWILGSFFCWERFTIVKKNGTLHFFFKVTLKHKWDELYRFNKLYQINVISGNSYNSFLVFTSNVTLRIE